MMVSMTGMVIGIYIMDIDQTTGRHIITPGLYMYHPRSIISLGNHLVST